MTVFANYGRRLWESGLSVIPLRSGEKIPAVRGWQIYCQRPAAESEIDEWEGVYGSGGIGLCTGPASGIVALDFDEDVDGLHAKIKAKLPPSPVRKRGARGETWFYKIRDERNRKWSKDGKCVLELLSIGRHTVLPPSIHPDTRQPYTWLTQDTLGDVELPLLPVDFVKAVDDLLGVTRLMPPVRSDLPPPDVEEVRRALDHISCEPYQDWVDCGMALHHAFGDAGFQLWDNWSSRGSTYKPDEMPRKWASFGRYKGRPIDIGTLFHHAIGQGWLPTPPDDDEFDASAFMASVEEHVRAKQSGLPVCMLRAPGYVGMLRDWIESTSRRETPLLSMAAAIAGAGAVYAHKIRTETDLRTNMYTLGIAASGTGKDHGRRCLDSLLNACGTEAAAMMTGSFFSESGIVMALHKRQGRALSIMDEMGKELEKLTHRNATVQSEVLTTLTKLATSATTAYRGREYADEKIETKVIQDPCLSVYGMSEPESFFAALKSRDASSGFLPRWLLFQCPDGLPKRKQGGSVEQPPAALLSMTNHILSGGLNQPTRDDPFAGLRPAIIPMTDGARRMWEALVLDMDERCDTAIIHKTGLHVVYGRVAEHAAKLALLAHEYGQISEEAMEWGRDVALYCADALAKGLAENVSDTEWGGFLKKLLGYVRESGTITHTALLKKFNSARQRDFKEAIIQLIDSGELDYDEKKGTTGKTVRYYRVRCRDS
jgi:hypothetical protein